MGHEGQVHHPSPEDFAIPLADKGQPSNSIDNGKGTLERLRNQMTTWGEQLGKKVKGTPITDPFLPSTANHPLQKKEYPDPDGNLEKLSTSGIETWDTKIAKAIGSQKGGVSTGALLFGSGIVVGGGLGVTGAYLAFASDNPPEIRDTDTVPGGTSFDNSRPIIPSDEAEASNNEGVFDNEAKKRLMSEKNTIPMTKEQYQQIAPPLIERKNPRFISGAFNLSPQAVEATGQKTRQVTLEQKTSVNAFIYVKTPEGKIRELTSETITDPGEIRQTDFVWPKCQVLLGLEGEIQQGDKQPAPISGRVYTHGLSSLGTGAYYVENEFRDPETGKLFKVTANISSGRTKTKPLKNIPELSSFINGTSWSEGLDKMPIVTVSEGEDLFEYTSKPDVRNITMLSNTKSQTVVVVRYEAIDKNGNTTSYGGENCLHPSIDGKAIVILQ